MFDKEHIWNILKQLESIKDNIFSLYLDVNPASLENVRDAYITRVKDALQDISIPKALGEQVLERLVTDRLASQGRTLVLFASENIENLFHIFNLQVELPFVSAHDGIIAYWGAPYLAPFLLVLDEYERYAVVYLDKERWRYFEIFLGEIEELHDAFIAVDTDAWRQLSESSIGAPGVIARGGSGKDLFEKRLDSWKHRFYKDTAKLLEQIVQKKKLDRLILIGSSEHLSDFEHTLSKHLQENVVEHLPPPSDPGASQNQVKLLVDPVIHRAKREKEKKLLKQIRESGIWGLENVLEALQIGQLHVLALPWNQKCLGRTIYRCEMANIVVSKRSQVEKLYPDNKIFPVSAGEALPQLAFDQKTRVEFMFGDTEKKLIEEFGGFAALKRW
jgi:hypothetical protein